MLTLSPYSLADAGPGGASETGSGREKAGLRTERTTPGTDKKGQEKEK